MISVDTIDLKGAIRRKPPKEQTLGGNLKLRQQTKECYMLEISNIYANEVVGDSCVLVSRKMQNDGKFFLLKLM